MPSVIAGTTSRESAWACAGNLRSQAVRLAAVFSSGLSDLSDVRSLIFFASPARFLGSMSGFPMN